MQSAFCLLQRIYINNDAVTVHNVMAVVVGGRCACTHTYKNEFIMSSFSCWCSEPFVMDHHDDIHRHAVLVVRCAATMRSKTPLSLALICLVSLIAVSHGFQVPSVRILRRAVSFAARNKLPPRNIKDTALPSSTSDAEKPKPGAWERLASSMSTTANLKVLENYEDTLERDQARVQLITLIRVGIPSLLAAVAAFFLFPALALTLASVMNDAGVFAVLSQDSSQFVQNFLTVSSLLFSILVGQTYYFMYGQQEAVYYALFNEVTEAKSLLEQVALVCQGRAMYPQVLNAISKYVQSDLKRLQDDPAVLLSARPVDDPLESIMYMTSVGVPSSVYETVRSLRQARAGRLGALQRKLPPIHLLLLWILAAIELVSFPLLGAGTQTIGGYNILTVEGCLFGVTTFGIVMTSEGMLRSVDRVLLLVLEQVMLNLLCSFV